MSQGEAEAIVSQEFTDDAAHLVNEPLTRSPSLRQEKVLQLTPEQFAQLKVKPTPSPEQLDDGRSNRRFLRSPHILQHTLSYPVLPLNLLHSENRRPRVFIKTPSGRTVLARYGNDMFRIAGVELNRPLVVVKQSSRDYDVTLSAIQSLDWLDALGDEENLMLQIVPAGSFSYTQSAFGSVVRFLMKAHSLYENPARLCGIRYKEVRVAAVLIPRVKFKGEDHLILTQRVTRKKGGVYNGLWVFPGGHVEAQETVEDGAAREFAEETGLEIDPTSIKLRTCWQEVLPPRHLQFLMLVFSADVRNEKFQWNDLRLQKEEVHALALIPKKAWKAVAHREDSIQMEFPCVKYPHVDESGNGMGDFVATTIPANDVIGLGHGRGIGGAHRYALMQYIDPFDKKIGKQQRNSVQKSRHASQWHDSLSALVAGTTKGETFSEEADESPSPIVSGPLSTPQIENELGI